MRHFKAVFHFRRKSILSSWEATWKENKGNYHVIEFFNQFIFLKVRQKACKTAQSGVRPILLRSLFYPQWRIDSNPRHDIIMWLNLFWTQLMTCADLKQNTNNTIATYSKNRLNFNSWYFLALCCCLWHHRHT